MLALEGERNRQPCAAMREREKAGLPLMNNHCRFDGLLLRMSFLLFILMPASFLSLGNAVSLCQCDSHLLRSTSSRNASPSPFRGTGVDRSSLPPIPHSPSKDLGSGQRTIKTERVSYESLSYQDHVELVCDSDSLQCPRFQDNWCFSRLVGSLPFSFITCYWITLTQSTALKPNWLAQRKVTSCSC